ncbi:MAG: alkaline phosphatase family protein, partial [Acidobacteriota bacterium]
SEQAKRIASNRADYFHHLITLRLEGQDALFDRVLHEQAETIRSAWMEGGEGRGSLGIARFSARDLYAILAYGQREESEVSFAKFFEVEFAPRMSGGRLMAAIGDAKQLRVRNFLVEAIRADRVREVLEVAGSERSRLVALAVAGVGTEPEAALAAEVLEAYAELVSPGAMEGALLDESRRNEMAAGLLAAWLERLRGGLVNKELSALAKGYQTYLPNVDVLQAADVCRDKVCTQRLLFFDDDDGAASFRAFQSQYAKDSSWAWEDHGGYVRVWRKGAAGLTVEVFANRPQAGGGAVSMAWQGREQEAQDAFARVLNARGAARIFVQRGHAYHVAKAIQVVPEAARLVYLGGCRGTENLSSVLARAPQTQIIATRSTGTMDVNDPLLKAMNDELADSGRIVWVEFWRRQRASFSGSRLFARYIPPNRNGAVILMQGWRRFQTERGPRALVISLDGLGYQALMQDAATRDMPALRALMDRGTVLPMQPAFPSTTANSHVALATGAWGDVNGIHANLHAVLPRKDHTSFERSSGFRADGLTAEPVWVTAARQGLRTAAVNFVPTYPFLPTNAPPGVPLTVINNYQTRKIMGNRLLTQKDVQAKPCGEPRRCFSWREEGVTFQVSAGASKRGVYDHIDITEGSGGKRVRAWAAALEDAPPTNRALARHFSEGLLFEAPVPAVVYFRLFEIAPDGSAFTLLRTAAQELGVFDAQPEALRRRILAEAGGVIDNGTALGSPMDDVSLRRTLELDELVIRQQGRLQEWLWRNGKYSLQAGYFSYPDHTEHAWLGLSEGNPRIAFARRWMYTALDQALKPIIEGVSTDDSIVFVSDHGMGAVQKHIRFYLPLERAGLVARTNDGQLDTQRSKMSGLYNCLLVNTRDWKDGIVPIGERDSLLRIAQRVLADLLDPETRRPVIQAFYSTPEQKAALGFGGEAGADLCLDPAPGYYLNFSFNGPLIETLKQPTGQHGGYPLRDDMRSVFIGAGPRMRIAGGAGQLRAIDVATLVTDLLGIEKPAQSTGRSPLQSQ